MAQGNPGPPGGGSNNLNRRYPTNHPIIYNPTRATHRPGSGGYPITTTTTMPMNQPVEPTPRPRG